jgi:ribosomal protein L13E
VQEENNLVTATRPKVFKNDGKQRLGRGFSREELKKAGSSLKEAVRLGLPVDEKRKTAHDENVAAAKTSLQERRPASKPKPASKPEPSSGAKPASGPKSRRKPKS